MIKRYHIDAPAKSQYSEGPDGEWCRWDDIETVHLLLEHVGEGVQVLGVFSTPGLASRSARLVAEAEERRFGRPVADTLQRLHVTTFHLDDLDYP